MATSRRQRPIPSREELQKLLARRQTLGTLIDFAEALEPDDVEPVLRLLCSFLAVDGSGDAAQLRLLALLGALVTRYLFSIAALPRSRDRVI